MSTQTLSPGIAAHALPKDLRDTLLANAEARAKWEDITPLARNEWICWVENAKHLETRNKRISRVCSELIEGMRRPCCWIGCTHRSDKAMSASQKWVLERQSKSKR